MSDNNEHSKPQENILIEDSIQLNHDYSQVHKQSSGSSSNAQLKFYLNPSSQQPSFSEQSSAQYHSIKISETDNVEEMVKQLFLKISQQAQNIIKLEEHNYYYKNQCFSLLKENQALRDKESEFSEKYAIVEQQIMRCNEEINHLLTDNSQKEKRKEMQRQQSCKNAEIEDMKNRIKSYQNIIVKKDQQINQFYKKNKNIIKINTMLESELRSSQTRLIELERYIHDNVCERYLLNVNKLKQNFNGINKGSNIESPQKDHFRKNRIQSMQNRDYRSFH